MRFNISLKLATVMLLITASTGSSAEKKLGWVSISGDRKGFKLSSPNSSFRPFGFNYDRDHKMRLIEDYWESDWQTVVEDFREMKSLGANVVRVHLQFAKFMDGPEQPNQRSLASLKKLLRLAEETRLYLDITGLGSYRKKDVPPWYDALKEQDRWAAQAQFWGAIARACKDSPAVFCYDLMNEPVVPGAARAERDWLVAHLLDLWYVQAITLDPAGRDRAQLARNWVERLTVEIRRHDKRHLITVGTLPNSLEDPVSESGFVPSKVAPALDFLSVHVYPSAASLAKDLKTLHGFQVGKPLMVEEIFPLNGGLDVLEKFMSRGSADACGWIGFYWGQTPEELSKSNEMSAAVIRAWLEFFRNKAAKENSKN